MSLPAKKGPGIDGGFLMTAASPNHTTPIPPRVGPGVIWGYFIVGLLSVIFFRLIPIANYVHPILGKLSWYGAVISSMIFFLRRGKISRRRLRLVQERELVEKVEGRKPLTDEEYQTLGYILWSNQASKEWANYLAIFILSLLGLVVAVILDLR